MQVEIYDMMEIDAELNREPDAESIALIEELGLQGQQEMVNDQGERQPYQKATKEQAIICSTLFPTFTTIDRYNEGPIPYRVLKEAKVARDHFQYLYVLYDTPAQVKDPVLVGSNVQIYNYSSNMDNEYSKLHLIARWGDALESWGDLAKKARRIRQEDGVERFNELMAYFDGIAKGIREKNIQVRFGLNVSDIIDSIVDRDPKYPF